MCILYNAAMYVIRILLQVIESAKDYNKFLCYDVRMCYVKVCVSGADWILFVAAFAKQNRLRHLIFLHNVRRIFDTEMLYRGYFSKTKNISFNSKGN